ncbi:hypothetical protein [Chryseobacterium limigenitum]|uniref:Uncharacterized protein n=1 Tax=Chryseobacterium limigenitum TaxID=1612149 RepID=A0A1K2IV35_9FLAO|nr:hypothetical protein [Chryseobacterium limigenitum]SFZ95603.1 hypothetical protein SAMN05216324_11158 [Chryseobacterium limigenitum]
MNIDELKNTWNEDDSFEETPEISIEQKNKINLPLEKMRKNMRMEFLSTIGIFIFGFMVVWIPVPEAPFKFKFYLTILLVSMALVTFFFFSKFFRLYKEMGSPMLKTYDSLQDLLHQLNLNKQYYVSFYLSFVPFLVCELIIVIECIPHPHPLSDMQIATTLIGSVSVGLFLLYLVGNWWFKYFYGKHIAKIENLLKELKQ